MGGRSPVLFPHIPTRNSRIPGLTVGPDVDEGIVGHHQLVEVEFVGEPLALGLVQDPLVVVISGNWKFKKKNK